MVGPSGTLLPQIVCQAASDLCFGDIGFQPPFVSDRYLLGFLGDYHHHRIRDEINLGYDKTLADTEV